MKKILLYNWVQFDENAGGGVTVYCNNIIDKMKDNPDVELYFLSSGSKYNFLSSNLKIKPTKNKFDKKVKTFTIYNSPTTVASSQFSKVDIYNNDKSLYDLLEKFIQKHGEFDVIHFNNLEGLSIEVLKLKEKYPNTKFIYSIHNYFPICPNVFLWKHNQENCKNFENGNGCCNCIASNYARDIKKLKMANALKSKKIKGYIKKLKNTLIKHPENTVSTNEPINNIDACSAKDYEEFREKNVEFFNKYLDEILCVSKRVKEIAIHYGIREEKCKVSYIGSKVANNLKRQNIDIKSKKFNLIYLGYMDKKKGFDFLIKALTTLNKDVAKNINLYLVCRNNNEYDIDKILQALKDIFNEVTYINGYTHDDLENLLNNKHLGVVPVLWEDNLPQVAIEMTAYGVPILASNLGGASELCNNEAFSFEGNNLKDFQKKLIEIVNNRELLQDFWKDYNKPLTMEEHLKQLYKYYGI